MKKQIIILLALALLVTIGWLFFRPVQQTPTSSPSGLPASQPAAAAEGTSTETSVHSPQAKPALPSGVVAADQFASNPVAIAAAPPATTAPPAVEPTFESTNLPPATILENMRTVIRQYGTMFGGNPVGTNPEITKALQGDNPKHVNFLKADGNRVNANGELVDPWGTPYFFHQLSGSETEIRSAGPDRVMYTSDDLVIK